MVAAATNVGPGAVRVASNARWGAMRLVRAWLAPVPAPDERSINRLDAVADLPARPPELTIVWQADRGFDRRAASLALREVLSAWRAAERVVAATSPEDDDFARGEGEVTVLRAAYQRRFEAVRTRLHEG
jgi:hypothetical protein